MKQIKTILLIILSLLPIQAIAYALDYNASIAFPEIDEEKLKEEFFSKLDSDLLPEKYYVFLEKYGVDSSDSLRNQRNTKIFNRLLRQYKIERIDSIHLASGASSVLPD